MKWIVTISVLLALLFIIIVTGGAWNITFSPDRFLAVPTSIWLSVLIMIFIVFLCIIAGKIPDSQEDDQI